VIGPGWMPRPAAAMMGWRRRRRTLPYTPRRARRKFVVSAPRRMNDQEVIFDQRGELPVATLVPHERRTQVIAELGALRSWLAARWSWLRPRTVPVLVATAGMFAVLMSADYLAHGRQCAPGPAPHMVTLRVTPTAP
jgi:hypothetical protein